jgi:hypothetical protein
LRANVGDSESSLATWLSDMGTPWVLRRALPADDRGT